MGTERAIWGKPDDGCERAVPRGPERGPKRRSVQEQGDLHPLIEAPTFHSDLLASHRGRGHRQGWLPRPHGQHNEDQRRQEHEDRQCGQHVDPASAGGQLRSALSGSMGGGAAAKADRNGLVPQR